jgi:hypothetical protein
LAEKRGFVKWIQWRPALRAYIRAVTAVNIALMSAYLLAGCAHDQGPTQVITIPAKAPPPILCQPIPPEPEPAGAIVRPITPQEIEAHDRFMDAEIDVRLWGRSGWARALKARETYCPK